MDRALLLSAVLFALLLLVLGCTQPPAPVSSGTGPSGGQIPDANGVAAGELPALQKGGLDAGSLSPTFDELSPILGLEDVTSEYYNGDVGSPEYPVEGLENAFVGVALTHPDNFLNQAVISIFVFESDEAAVAFFDKRAAELEREIAESPFEVSGLERSDAGVGERSVLYAYRDIPDDSGLFGSLYHAEVLSQNGRVTVEALRISAEPDEDLGPSLVQVAELVFQKQGR